MTVRLEQLLADATPGPWKVDDGWEDYGNEALEHVAIGGSA